MKLRKPTRGSAASSPARSLLSRASAWHQASGRPASCNIATKRKQESGVASAGLTMTGHPAAIAGATWCTIRFSGWLKALSATTTPIGSRCVKAIRPAEAGLTFIGTTSPPSLRRSSQQLRTPSMARATSTREFDERLAPFPSGEDRQTLGLPFHAAGHPAQDLDPAQRRQPSPAIPEEAVRDLESAVDRLTPRERDRADRRPIEGGPDRDLPQSSRPAHSTAASWRSFSSSTSTRTFSE